MFYNSNSKDYKEIIPGVKLKTLSYGEKTLLSEFRIGQGVSLPKHFHPCEQTGYLVSGSILLTIGEDTYEVSPGDSWSVLSNVEHSAAAVMDSNVEHSAAAVKDSIIVEVFSPVREEYLPENM